MMPGDPANKLICTLQDVLDATGPRPHDVAHATSDKHRLSEEKRIYAARFANKMATCIANGLRERFPGILPGADGRGIESPAQSVRGPKKLDVNYSTPQLGLGFGISLKSVHFREKPVRGYIHNRKRNDEEWRTEASGYHQRQPYAIMIAVLFLPDEACDDASPRSPSSFGSWVKYLRPLALRHTPQDDIARYERVFVALYDRRGQRMEFFDVEKAPPKIGRPKSLLSYGEFLDEIEKTFIRRNASEFQWADDLTLDLDEVPTDEDT